MDYIEHITQDGERWDLIAWRYYGDAARIAPLAEANPHLQLAPVLTGGLPVRVPVLQGDGQVPGFELPPWMR